MLGKNIFFPGRHKCDCEANRHALINNCLNCGRIVCVQEGSGPCFFCGELVCSPEEQVLLRSNTKQGDNLYNKLMDQKPNKDLEDSLKQRDKLLEFDRNRYIFVTSIKIFYTIIDCQKFAVPVALK